MGGGEERAVVHEDRRTRSAVRFVLATLTLLPVSVWGGQQKSAVPPATRVVFLGTGMPRPDPQHQGPAAAVVAGGNIYIVDAGVGVVRQAVAAGLDPTELRIAFITHLHSDHTLGLPDLILTPWVVGRKEPLELYGPTGVKAMAASILEAYQQDIHIRLTGGEEPNSTGYHVNAHEIRPGLVYEDAAVRVKAFAVKHGTWPEAYGYRFETPGGTVVFSGDTRPAESVVEACRGCDLLVHEVYSGYGGTAQQSADEWMKYMAAFHTSAQELGDLAARAHAKTLVVTHVILLGGATESDLAAEIRKKFSGTVVIAHDLDVVVP
jgi:ribonuclease BN (tRNA processing enzyme)